MVEVPFCEPDRRDGAQRDDAPGRTRAMFEGPATVMITWSRVRVPVPSTEPPPEQALSAGSPPRRG